MRGSRESKHTINPHDNVISRDASVRLQVIIGRDLGLERRREFYCVRAVPVPEPV